MSSIWHTKRKKATEDKTIFAIHKSIIRDSGVDWFIWEPQEFTDATRADVIAWCYLDDLLRLEAKLEHTRKVLDKAKNGLKELKDVIACPPDISYETCVSMYADGVLQEITTLEQKN